MATRTRWSATTRKSRGRRPPETIRDALSGGDRDAGIALARLFRSYGIVTLTDEIIKFIKAGYSSDTITLMLQDTKEYKKRFAGNAAREKAGLPVLSPAEYLSVEASYRQVMQEAGVPPRFYDKPEDFAKWIGNDVSPSEIQSRVKSAQKLVEAVDPQVRREFDRYYTRGEMVAYALDRKRTAEILERQVRASEVGANLTRAGVGVDRRTAERIADLGVEAGAQKQGAATAAEYAQGFGMLGAISGEEYGGTEAVEDVFLNSAEAGGTRRRLASQERGRFSGSTGANETTLTRSRGGNV